LKSYTYSYLATTALLTDVLTDSLVSSSASSPQVIFESYILIFALLFNSF
jgi:hypothetical protein